MRGNWPCSRMSPPTCITPGSASHDPRTANGNHEGLHCGECGVHDLDGCDWLLVGDRPERDLAPDQPAESPVHHTGQAMTVRSGLNGSAYTMSERDRSLAELNAW